MELVAVKLTELEEKGLDLEALQGNEQFISVVMQATTLAMRTHQQEKLEALRNAVINVAMGQGPDDARQHFFLECVGSLSELQLRILKFFQSPPPISVAIGGALSQVLEQHMPELVGQRYLYDQLWKDLHAKGLTNTGDLHSMMSNNGLREKRTSDLGDMFLGFIADRHAHVE